MNLVTRGAKALAGRVDPDYIHRGRWHRAVRRALILVCVAAGLFAWGAFAQRHDQTVFSPGPLTGAHAMWDGNQCAWCHDAAPGGGFARAVSDTACLQCHDATAHHPNQVKFVSASAGGGGGAGATMRSADCIACHREHRGHEALAARADSNCTQCHADLPASSRDGKPKVAAHVAAFAAGAHPAFGRSLTADPLFPTAVGGPPVDPTPLRFNHARHQTEVKPLAGQAENCTICHAPATGSGGGGGAGRPAYIAPVNYERHCAECHKLGVDDKSVVVVPHQSMDVVRLAVRGIAADPAAALAGGFTNLPQADREAALTKVTRVKKSAFSSEFVTKKVTITKEQWATETAASMAGKFAPPDGQAGRLDPAALGNFVVREARHGGKNYGCALCHELTDSPAANAFGGLPLAKWSLRAVPAGPPPATAPTTAVATASAEPAASNQPATAAEPAAPTAPAVPPSPTIDAPLATLPTGFARGPRRWFVNSRFDHGAHRSMSCVDCHTQAKGSSLTRDVLMPTMESCVQCHKPTAAVPLWSSTPAAGRGAGTACASCHDYHDHSRERSADGTLGRAALLAPKPPGHP